MQNKNRIVKRPAHAIESVENALRLLVLLQERESVRIVDAAKDLGVASSTAHRLMATLVYRGFARQDEHRRYLAGPNLRLDASQDPMRNLVAAFRQPMEELAAATGETVNLVELVGRNAKFLYSVEGPQLLRIGDRAGSVLPANISAGGLAALSVLPESSVAELYRGGSTRRGGNELNAHELQHLFSELAQVRTRGYSLNLGRTEHELAAIGAPVGLPGQQRALAISLSAPLSRAEELQSPLVVSLLNGACDRISTDLYQQPDQPILSSDREYP